MIENIKILATSFDSNDISLEHGCFVVKEKGLFGKKNKYPAEQIKSIEIANENNTKKLGGTVGGAVVGGILTGGVGAIVGALAGGNKSEIVFIAEFNDGNQLMAKCSNNAYLDVVAKIKQLEMDKIKEQNKSNKPKEKSSLKENIGGIVVLIIFGFILKSCFTKDKDSSAQPTSLPPIQQVDPSTKIASYAVETMNAKDYPKAFKQFGKQYMARVNQLAPSAALKIAKENACDKVEIVTFSTTKSTKGEIQWVIDCANKSRYYVSEKEL